MPLWNGQSSIWNSLTQRTAACPSLDGRSLVKLEHAKNQKRQRKKIDFGLQKIIMLVENKPIVQK